MANTIRVDLVNSRVVLVLLHVPPRYIKMFLSTSIENYIMHLGRNMPIVNRNGDNKNRLECEGQGLDKSIYVVYKGSEKLTMWIFLALSVNIAKSCSSRQQ